MSKQCTTCSVEKPLDDFYRSSKVRDGRTSSCVECLRKRASDRYRTDPGYQKRMRATVKAWRDRVNEWRRWQGLFNRYKLTLDQFAALEESQNFCCVICGEYLDGVSNIHTDHNHATDKVRGLLCKGCNMGLGNFSDSEERLRQAADYLHRKGSYAENYLPSRQEV